MADGSGDGSGLSLPSQFDPYVGPIGEFDPKNTFQDYVDGIRVLRAFAALMTAAITSVITAFFGGLAGIQAGIGHLVADPLDFLASLISAAIETLFGIDAAYDAAWQSAEGTVTGMGLFSFVAGVVVVAMTAYAVAWVAQRFAGGVL